MRLAAFIVRRWKTCTAALTLAVVVVVLGFDHWLPYMLLSHYRFSVDEAPTAFVDYQAKCEGFEVIASDGPRIEGWLIPAAGKSSAPSHTVIFLHPLGRTRQDMLELALPVWRHGGCQLVLIDLRGHGESDGDFFTYGYHEWRDVAAVLDFLERQHATDRYSVVGVSSGGAVAISAAQRDRRIHSVVTVGTFADLHDAIEDQAAILPSWWTDRAIRRAEVLADFSVEQTSPEKIVSQLTCPILIVHGEEDHYIPYSNAVRLYDAAHEPKTLYAIPGATHASMFSKGGDALVERIAGFLELNE